MLRRLRRTAGGLSRFVYSSGELQMYVIDPAPYRSLPARDEFHRNDPDAIRLYRPTESGDLSIDRFAQVFRRRLAAGHTVFTVHLGDTLTHYRWLSRAGHTYVDETTNIEYRFPGRTRVTFDVCTHPSARRGGLRARGGECALREAALDGVALVHSFVEHDNHRTMRSVARFQFSYVGSVWSTRILGRLSRRASLPAGYEACSGGALIAPARVTRRPPTERSLS